jgi:hypothetical protein
MWLLMPCSYVFFKKRKILSTNAEIMGYIAGVPAAPKREKTIVSPLDTPHRPAK